MIEVRELRIGNLVNRLGNSTKINAIQIDIEGDGYLSTERTGAITKNQVDPIPLTEEWLLKSGFEKNEWSGLDFSGTKRVNGCDYYKESTSTRISLNDDVCKKGVHWFQNWYYFETGSELECN